MSGRAGRGPGHWLRRPLAVLAAGRQARRSMPASGLFAEALEAGDLAHPRRAVSSSDRRAVVAQVEARPRSVLTAPGLIARRGSFPPARGLSRAHGLVHAVGQHVIDGHVDEAVLASITVCMRKPLDLRCRSSVAATSSLQAASRHRSPRSTGPRPSASRASSFLSSYATHNFARPQPRSLRAANRHLTGPSPTARPGSLDQRGRSDDE